jgi:hypothetical protein
MAILNKEWSLLKTQGEQLRNERIPLVNKQLWQAGIGAVE